MAWTRGTRPTWDLDAAVAFARWAADQYGLEVRQQATLDGNDQSPLISDGYRWRGCHGGVGSLRLLRRADTMAA